MYRKVVFGVAILATTSVPAFAQDDPSNQAPKLTLADVQQLAQAISSDMSKLRAYCELGKLHDDTQQAVEAMDTKAIEMLIAKTDALEQQLGPEYDKVIEGLDQIDFSSAEGQEIAEVFKTLQAKCE
jgi:D-alanyl-D-alanine dipeptidase